MENENGRVDVLDVLVQLVVFEIVEELLGYFKRSPADVDRGVSFGNNLLEALGEVSADVGRSIGRTDGRYGFYRIQHGGGAEHRRTAETVTDQERRRLVVTFQPLRRGDQVRDISRKVGIDEIPLTAA